MSQSQKPSTNGADEVFCEFGWFVVLFERVVQSMGFSISFILSSEGLRNQQLGHIVLADQTAAPIKSILQAQIGEVAKPDQDEATIISKIFKRIQELIEQRNLLVHGFSAIGQRGGEAAFTSNGYKLKRKASGVCIQQFRLTVGDFRNLCLECNEVEALVDRVTVTILQKKKFTATFTLAGGVVALAPRFDQVAPEIDASPDWH